LIVKLRESGQADFDKLANFKKQETGDENAILNPWDHGFYANILKKKDFDVDE